MARLVMKFGGTSVADLEKIRNVAAHVAREVSAGYRVAVVVSAMAGHTDQLVDWCREAADKPDMREFDAVVAAGEQVTAGLLALVLQQNGFSARSWTGWQIPIITSNMHGAARIQEIKADTLEACFEQTQVAVIAGFQGLADDNRIATLGRGGSDTSAVALAAALDARCDIYTDVDGVYTTDPRIVDNAHRLERITYEEMLELASAGARVLQTRSVELAMFYKVPLRVRSSFDAPDKDYRTANGGNDTAGTLLCDEDEIVEQQIVSGIAYSPDEAKVSIRRVKDRPGVSAGIFGPLADADISVDMIVQNVSADGETANVTFTVARDQLSAALAVLEQARTDIGFEELESSDDVAKVSVIGIGMRSHAGVASKMFAVLAERGINIQAITTSEIKISVLIDRAFTELAVRSLHTAYELDGPS